MPHGFHFLLRAAVGLALSSFATVQLHADRVDETVAAVMAKRRIPGLSLAIVDGGKIVKAQAYGVGTVGSQERVGTETLFQAGSISKAVAAVGALALVEGGQLSLDADVNASLKTWRIPENEFTREQKVTVRRLLSHCAGLTVHGFPGYRVDAAHPTLVQILDGEKPANTPAVRVDYVPGSKWRYSGGGYTVLQQLMIDVTKQSFPAYMQLSVLAPLGMSSSSFEQPLPAALASRTPAGHSSPRRPVSGRSHLYPEMAAAGLWTTPSDLARFVIFIQESLAGRASVVLSPAMTKQMLTAEREKDGLGLFVPGPVGAERFEHGGRDEGFDAYMVGYFHDGKGAVVMINANDNARSMPRVVEAIADVYGWREFPRFVPPKAIEDKEPSVTALIRLQFEEAQAGRLDRDLYTPALADNLEKAFKGDPADELRSLGPFQAIELIAQKTENGIRRYRHRIVWQNDTILTTCIFNPEGKIASIFFQPE